MLTPEIIRSALHYNPETGALTWKHRPTHPPQWNGRWVGKPALTAKLPGGYGHGCVNGIRIRAHRAAWAIHFGEMPSSEIDHRDGNPENNRIKNLRLSNRVQQNRNQRRRKNNTSGQMGVYQHSKGGWVAQINNGSGMVYLGYFKDKASAIARRKQAELDLGYSERHGS